MSFSRILVKNYEIQRKHEFFVIFTIEKDFKFKIKLNPYTIDFAMYFVIGNKKCCYYDWRLNRCHVLNDYSRDIKLKICFTSVKFIICCLQDFIFLVEEEMSNAYRPMKIYEAYKIINNNSKLNKTVRITSFSY